MDTINIKTARFLTVALLILGCCFMSSCKDKKKNKKDSTEESSDKISGDVTVIEIEIPVKDILKDLAGIKEDGQNANFDKALAQTDTLSENYVSEFCDNYIKTGGNLKPLFAKNIQNIWNNPVANDDELKGYVEEEVNHYIDISCKTIKNRLERCDLKNCTVKATDKLGHIKITIPHTDDLERIYDLITRQGNLEFYETYQYKDIANAIKDLSDSYSMSTTSSDSTGNAKSLLSLIGGADGNSPVAGNALVSDTAAVNKIIYSKLAKEKLPNDLKLCWYVKSEKVQDNQPEKFQLVALKTKNGEPSLTGDVVTSATTTSYDYDNVKYSAINITMNDVGAKRWSRITADNIGKSLAIVLDDHVYSFPRVNDQIAGGRSEITGDFTHEEANDLAIVLESGKLNAKPRIIKKL